MEIETPDEPVGTCPHCGEAVLPIKREIQSVTGRETVIRSGVIVCPECDTILGATEASATIPDGPSP